MQHVRQIEIVHAFTRAEPEAILLLNIDNLRYLTDIQIFLSLKSTFPSALAQTSEVSNLRVYFDSYDVTQKLLEALVVELSGSPNARAQYVNAMQQWMKLLRDEARLIGLDARKIAENEQLCIEYAQKPWVEFFSSFGNAGFGYRGALHPFNFLYTQIAVRPLSLRAILYPGAPTTDRPLNRLQDPRVIASHGPCRLYGGNSNPISLQYEGIAAIKVSCVFEDSWEAELHGKLSRISNKMIELSDKMNELDHKYEKFEMRAAEFKSLADGIDASLLEFKKCN